MGIEEPDLPLRYALYQNAPNPPNPATEIGFDVPAPGGHVTLEVFDVSGRCVATLVGGHVAPGRQVAAWDGTDDRGHDVSSGVYYYRLRALSYERTLRMTLLK